MMKTINTRFVSHVYPGETIIVEMFKEGNSILFSATTKERGLKVSTGCVDLKSEAKL
jgi:3-hydroxymyristoyl/3-hydroxydecanoyl-(acyl carrier protein) dehydratase